jgi:predicted small metal-binding protein
MGLNCSFVVKGATRDEVTKKALEHVLEKHEDEFLHHPFTGGN